ncbi:uncharacterized protein A4U43_C04F3870 [Asparagus officinalis]|uniref:Uncharacterized protein n=1 Tax=Asparagus officinalis TaxID=4686 RepID=A0A5P1EY16_ASPOF|nr:uncharacterized protein A4U43_C04F3870 [Asparagus officinalis]
MASSRVMASSSSATSGITRQSSIYSLKSLGSMNIDELFRNIDAEGSSGGVGSGAPLRDDVEARERSMEGRLTRRRDDA